eukprot:CAMPEP_0113600546 /NCGR_PEP_ID=MMETSP0015_2-20120614/42760_1 /TAXON_ID=2838 /ORGANISM="Odontella" /LENGTH=603 /DNA_ID=CAMNT_0000508801 /DNA_START=87 /DNA_END=1898 /DNA_ORIENTATION=- /assembly_acc=CAM_ASM_000160
MARLATSMAVAAGLAVSAVAQTPRFTPVSLGTSNSKGTGVAALPDGSKVYITSDDGTLVIADGATGDFSKMTQPGASCKTVASISPDGQEVLYTYETATNSVIQAYSVSDDSATWSYTVAGGKLAGAPKYSEDSMKVYFTWNDSEGHFSVLTIAGDGMSASETFAKSLTDLSVGGPKGVNATLIDTDLGFTGVDVSYEPMRNTEEEDDDGEGTGEYYLKEGGNYRFGEDNGNDLVVFAHLPKGSPLDPNYPTSYAFSHYYAYQAGLSGPGEVSSLGTTTWASIRPPILSKNGVRMAVAAQRGNVRAWTENELISQGANIKVNIKQQQRTNAEPSYSTPSFNADDSKIFVASNKNALYGIDATEPTLGKGDQDEFYLPYLWETLTDSLVEAGTVATQDYVYAITSNGVAHKLGVSDGIDEWAGQAKLDQLFVQADFTISDGKMYFVTTQGLLHGWTVETVPTMAPTPFPTLAPVVPTEEPTSAPITAEPTSAPITAEPTGKPIEETASPTISMSSAPSTTKMMTQTTTTEKTMAPDVTTPMVPDVTTPMAPEETTTTTTTAAAAAATTTTVDAVVGGLEEDASPASKLSMGLAVVLGALALAVL